MSRERPVFLFACGLTSLLAACGGGGGSSKTPPPPTTYTLTVNSATPSSGVSIQVSPADNSGTGAGTTSFTRTYNAGTLVALTAPATTSSSSFTSWSGCASVNARVCSLAMTSNETVTATYATPTPATPTVTVTPAATSVTTSQPLSVSVAIASSNGYPTPTGSIILTSGAYASVATALSSGSATISIPAGSLSVGSDVLAAAYTPDSASAPFYNSASGQSAAVTVTAPPVTAVTVDQSSPGPAISDKLLGMNMAAWYDPTTSAVVPAFQTAGIKVVRWPGGSWSDVYHWATNSLCGGTPNTNATFANFVNSLVTPGNFDVSLTADYGTNATCNGPGDPSEAAAWIAQAKTLNAHVSYMTVGNEEYGAWETDLHTMKNDAATYAAAVGTASTSGYYSAIKTADSSVQVGVDVNPGNNPAWDPTVLANAQYDFVEYHYYPQAPGYESDAYLVNHGALDLTTQIDAIKTELSAAGKSGTPIYVGELGSVYTNPGKQTLSITQGLYAGQVLGELMNDGVARVTWWIGFGNCNGTSGNHSSSLYGWQNFGAYNVFADGPSDTGCAGAGAIGTLSPTARAFQLFSQVAVTGENVLTSKVTGDTTDVRSYAATHSGGTALVLFNLNETTSQSVSFTLSAQSSSTDVAVTTYSKAIYDQTNASTPVWAPPSSTDLGAQNLPLTITLNPWSMNVIIIK